MVSCRNSRQARNDCERGHFEPVEKGAVAFISNIDVFYIKFKQALNF